VTQRTDAQPDNELLERHDHEGLAVCMQSAMKTAA
jgi:hypothetical protein